MSNVIVISKADTKALVTVDAVRERFGVTEAQMATSRIQGMIDAASAQAEAFCRRPFGLQTIRERLAVSCGSTPLEKICVARTPIAAILSISANGDIVDPLDYEHNDSEVFNLDDNGESVPWYGRSFTLNYQAGYVLPGMKRDDPDKPIPEGAQGLPADVARAIMLLIAANLSGDDRDIMIKAEETEGVGREEYYVQGDKAELPHPEAASILRQYKWANI